MKRYFIHNPFFRLIAPAVYGVLSYFLILLVNNNVTQVNDFYSSEEVYSNIVFTYLSYESMRIIILLLDRFLPRQYRGMRIAIQLIIATVFSVGLVFIGLNLYFKYIVGFSISTTQVLTFGIVYIVTSLLYNILYFSNHYLQMENTVKINA
ncbi:MAG TPA: hypothetical protein VF141_07605, partial [Chryseolinea sp.]